jgi:hypothetical protein
MKTGDEIAEELGLHPLSHPLGDCSHHTDEPFTDEDKRTGEAVAWFLGDLFVDSRRHSPFEQWSRIARALRIHGLAIVDRRPSTAR